MKPQLNKTYQCFDVTDPLEICRRIFSARYPGATMEIIEHEAYLWIGPIPTETNIPPAEGTKNPDAEQTAISGGAEGDHDSGANGPNH